MTRIAVLVVAPLVVLAVWPPSAPSQETIPGATPPSAVVGHERLIEEASAQFDQLGRVPLARLTLAPGAELPAGFLAGPLLAVVESGTFDVQVGASSSIVAAGGRLDVADDSAIGARNTSHADGSWLVLVQRRDDAWFHAPFWGVPDQTPAPGVGFHLLFIRQNFTSVFAPVRIALDRVALAPGAAPAAIDFGGSMPMRFVALRVEAGALAVTGSEGVRVRMATPVAATPGAEVVLRAGDVAYVDPQATVEIHAAGGEPAVLLLARVAEDPQST